MENSPVIKSKNRKSKATRFKRAENYRAYNNQRSLKHFNELIQLVMGNYADLKYDLDIIGRARTHLLNNEFESIHKLLISIKLELMNVSMKLASEEEILEFEECEPLQDRLYNFADCVIVSDSNLDICIKSASPVVDRCDPAVCQTCTPLAFPDLPVVSKSGGVAIYAGPGSGKTTLIKQLPSEFRGVVYDSDHFPKFIKPDSLLFTNRIDVLNSFPGLRFAVVPSRSVWLERCRIKIPSAPDSWYDDLRLSVRRCFVIRSNKYLSDIIRLRGIGSPRARKRRAHAMDDRQDPSFDVVGRPPEH